MSLGCSQSYNQFPDKVRISTKLLIESKYSKLLSLTTTYITYFRHNYMSQKGTYCTIQKDLRCHLPVIENQWKQTAHNKKRSYIVKKEVKWN